MVTVHYKLPLEIDFLHGHPFKRQKIVTIYKKNIRLSVSMFLKFVLFLAH